MELFLDFTRQEDHAILISSHIVSDLEKLCDYIAFLHKGKLLLLEEKDRLLAEYGLLHCTAERLEELDPAAVKSKQSNMSGLLLKEFYMAWKYCRLHLVITVLFLGLAMFSSSDNLFLLVYPCALASFIPVTLQSYDTQSRWNVY